MGDGTFDDRWHVAIIQKSYGESIVYEESVYNRRKALNQETELELMVLFCHVLCDYEQIIYSLRLFSQSIK